MWKYTMCILQFFFFMLGDEFLLHVNSPCGYIETDL